MKKSLHDSIKLINIPSVTVCLFVVVNLKKNKIKYCHLFSVLDLFFGLISLIYWLLCYFYQFRLLDVFENTFIKSTIIVLYIFWCILTLTCHESACTLFHLKIHTTFIIVIFFLTYFHRTFFFSMDIKNLRCKKY